MGLHPGKQITESLRLSRLIGRGAMGSVWVADHLGLGSQVAVKFMAPAVAGDEVSVQRFRLEAKAAAEIRSPHVVQVFDHGVADDGQLYIVMELLEGESLERRVRRGGPLRPQELVAVVTQACKALAKAHERGIIHRDIKPANVFLLADSDTFVKLLDFGVAKFSGEEVTQMTAAGNVVGTPAFMSPEQLFHGQEIDHRGDLWSLAVVAYHALTGVRPFEGKTLGELCVAIKRGTYAAPSALAVDVPAEVDGWFARAFHQDIDARFGSAKEMAQALEAAVGSSSVMASTPSGVAAPVHTLPAVVSIPPRKSHRPVIFGAVAFTLAFGAAAAILVSTQSGVPGEVAPAASAEPAAETTSEAPETQEAQQALPPEAVSSAAPDPVPTVSIEVPIEGPPAGGGGAGNRGPNRTGPGPAKPDEDDRSKRAAETLGI